MESALNPPAGCLGLAGPAPEDFQFVALRRNHRAGGWHFSRLPDRVRVFLMGVDHHQVPAPIETTGIEIQRALKALSCTVDVVHSEIRGAYVIPPVRGLLSER